MRSIARPERPCLWSRHRAPDSRTAALLDVRTHSESSTAYCTDQGGPARANEKGPISHQKETPSWSVGVQTDVGLSKSLSERVFVRGDPEKFTRPCTPTPTGICEALQSNAQPVDQPKADAPPIHADLIKLTGRWESQ
jgi:hypothetical protein